MTKYRVGQRLIFCLPRPERGGDEGTGVGMLVGLLTAALEKVAGALDSTSSMLR